MLQLSLFIGNQSLKASLVEIGDILFNLLKNVFNFELILEYIFRSLYNGIFGVFCIGFLWGWSVIKYVCLLYHRIDVVLKVTNQGDLLNCILFHQFDYLSLDLG